MAITLNGSTGITSPGGDTSTSLSTGLLTVTGSTVPANGMYLPTTNTLAWATNSTERMRLDSSGNLGIGTSSPAGSLCVTGVSQGLGNNLATSNPTGGAFSFVDPNSATIVNTVRLGQDNGSSSGVTDVQIIAYGSADNQGGGNLRFINSRYSLETGLIKSSRQSTNTGYISFYTQGGSGLAERARIDSSGNLLVGQTATDAAAGGARFQLTQGNTNWIHFIRNSNTSGNVYGSDIVLSYAPNNTSSAFFACSDSSTERLRIYANGGIANYSANNVNLSDERVKTDITPAPAYLDKINAIEVVNFKYKDQTFDEPNLGVIAQQVLSVAPEFVDESGFGETPEDGIPLMAIYETDLKYAMLKAIQELTARLEALEGAK